MEDYWYSFAASRSVRQCQGVGNRDTKMLLESKDMTQIYKKRCRFFIYILFAFATSMYAISSLRCWKVCASIDWLTSLTLASHSCELNSPHSVAMRWDKRPFLLEILHGMVEGYCPWICDYLFILSNQVETMSSCQSCGELQACWEDVFESNMMSRVWAERQRES